MLLALMCLGAACADTELDSPQLADEASSQEPPGTELPDLSAVDYCEPLPAVGSIALLEDENALAAEAVNAYLRQALPAAAVAERICSVNSDFGRIYTAYDELYGGAGGSGLGEGVSIAAAGTMVQTPEGCWVFLMDGGGGLYQLDPLPRGSTRIGQRVELTLSGPIVYANIDNCPFPRIAASAARRSDWDVEPTERAMAFEPTVQSALEALGIEAKLTIDGTRIHVSGMDRDQVLPLEASLRGRYGLFILVGEDYAVHIWPAAEATGD